MASDAARIGPLLDSRKARHKVIAGQYCVAASVTLASPLFSTRERVEASTAHSRPEAARPHVASCMFSQRMYSAACWSVFTWLQLR